MKVIIYTRPDGGTDIIRPIYGAIDRPKGDTDDALIARCMRHVPGNAANVQVVDDTDLPQDRSKRHAWKIAGAKQIVVDNAIPAPPKSDIELLKEEVAALKNKGA